MSIYGGFKRFIFLVRHPHTKLAWGVITTVLAVVIILLTPTASQTPLIGQYIGQVQNVLGLGPKPALVTTGCGPGKAQPCSIIYTVQVVTSPINSWRWRPTSPSDSPFQPFNQYSQGIGSGNVTGITQNILMGWQFQDSAQAVSTIYFYQVNPSNQSNSVLVLKVSYNPGQALIQVSGTTQWWDPTCQPFPSNC